MLHPGSTAARLYLASVLALLVLVAPVTLERARALATGFDDLRTTCTAPCTPMPR
jgi:hypothetical protein